MNNFVLFCILCFIVLANCKLTLQAYSQWLNLKSIKEIQLKSNINNPLRYEEPITENVHIVKSVTNTSTLKHYKITGVVSSNVFLREFYADQVIIKLKLDNYIVITVSDADFDSWLCEFYTSEAAEQARKEFQFGQLSNNAQHYDIADVTVNNAEQSENKGQAVLYTLNVNRSYLSLFWIQLSPQDLLVLFSPDVFSMKLDRRKKNKIKLEFDVLPTKYTLSFDSNDKAKEAFEAVVSPSNTP